MSTHVRSSVYVLFLQIVGPRGPMGHAGEVGKPGLQVFYLICHC